MAASSTQREHFRRAAWILGGVTALSAVSMLIWPVRRQSNSQAALIARSRHVISDSETLRWVQALAEDITRDTQLLHASHMNDAERTAAALRADTALSALDSTKLEKNVLTYHTGLQVDAAKEVVHGYLLQKGFSPKSRIALNA